MNSQNKFLLKVEHILASHQLMIEEHGGANGILDKGLIDSVIGSVEMATKYEHLTAFQIAAKYGYKLVKNHCFQDGNKRVGAHVMLTYLEVLGFELETTDQEVVDITLKVATSQIEETSLAKWLESKVRQT